MKKSISLAIATLMALPAFAETPQSADIQQQARDAGNRLAEGARQFTNQDQYYIMSHATVTALEGYSFVKISRLISRLKPDLNKINAATLELEKQRAILAGLEKGGSSLSVAASRDVTASLQQVIEQQRSNVARLEGDLTAMHEGAAVNAVNRKEVRAAELALAKERTILEGLEKGISVVSNSATEEAVNAYRHAQSQQSALVNSLQRDLRKMQDGIFERLAKRGARLILNGARVYIVAETGSKLVTILWSQQPAELMPIAEAAWDPAVELAAPEIEEGIKRLVEEIAPVMEDLEDRLRGENKK